MKLLDQLVAERSEITTAVEAVRISYITSTIQFKIKRDNDRCAIT